MIQGAVNARHEAIVRLHVRGPRGTADVDFMVDSGFTSSLTLPPSVVAELGLIWNSGGTATLADGSVRKFDIFAAEVEWDGMWRSVLVTGVGHRPLLGMRLLAGHKLVVDVKLGGLVENFPNP